MKLKAFEFEATSNGFEEITINLSMGDNLTEIKTFSKAEIAEHLGYDVRKNGVHFTADDFNPYRGHFERDFFEQWEDFEFDRCRN
jgi:gamma-glutamyltranspeptidase